MQGVNTGGVVDRECRLKGRESPGRDERGKGGGESWGNRVVGEGWRIRMKREGGGGGRACGEEYSDWLRDEASGRLW